MTDTGKHNYNSIRSQFINPDEEFSPVPFWFWNDDIKEAELTRQIEAFKEKGVDAFVIHPRIGMPESLQYMSEEFLSLVKHAVAEACRINMKVVLYDEAMYPSGSAHGMVAKNNPMYKSRGIRRVYDKTTLSADDVIIYEQDGVYYAEGFTGGTIRGIHFGEDDGEEFAPESADLLNKNAVQCFISLTHDKYYNALSEYFGDTVTGIFTDEPSITGRRAARGFLPWSADFLEYYIKSGGSIKDIPKLWDDCPESRLYRRAVTARIEETYYTPIAEWCEKHKVVLMGHPEKSDDIALLKYFHIPGQDLVLRWVAPENNTSLTGTHSTQAKCSSDSARHAGKRRNSNECFGACNRDNIPWYFTGDDMKWYIDWLCVRGVNMLIPHAFYYSVEGKRKYERPPDVGPNNIWWDDYRVISTYMKRMCWLMTDSVNNADIAVLCGDDNLDWQETSELYQNQIEFNYLQDCYIEEKYLSNGNIYVGNNKYNVLLIPQGTILSGDKRGLLNKHNIKTIVSAEEAMSTVRRDIQCGKYEPDLRFSHVIKDNKHFYLFVNEGERDIDTEVTVYTTGACEFWNPLDGTAVQATITEITEDSIKIRLKLDRRESIILFADESGKPEMHSREFRTVRIDNIENNEFYISEGEKTDRILLDLGSGHEYVQLYINGKYAGTGIWGSYIFDITDYVVIGRNSVQIIEKECKACEYGGLNKKK